MILPNHLGVNLSFDGNFQPEHRFVAQASHVSLARVGRMRDLGRLLSVQRSTGEGRSRRKETRIDQSVPNRKDHRDCVPCGLPRRCSFHGVVLLCAQLGAEMKSQVLTQDRVSRDSRPANRIRRVIPATLATLAMIAAPILGGGVAIADTGGSGGGDGGSGGGSGDPNRKVYLDVYDHVAVEVDPITGQRPAGQGWGQDSINFFVQRADARLKTAPRPPATGNDGSGAGRWESFSNNHTFANGKTLVQMINQQCSAVIDQAVSRNPQATSARVVALQFPFAIGSGNMGTWWAPDWYYTVTPSHVNYPHWRDTLDEDASTYAAMRIGTWSTEKGDLVADGDGDGIYTNGEYINAADLDPTAQPTVAIRSELNGALEMAWDAANPDNHYGGARLVSCVAMNDRAPAGLIPDPGIDVSKNAEDLGGEVERLNLPGPGPATVTVDFKNTGDEDLGSLTFADSTSSGNGVKWTSIKLPNGSIIPVGGTGTPADVWAALVGVTLPAAEPGEDSPAGAVTVLGTVQVDVGTLHADRVIVTGMGGTSGQIVTDNDATEYYAEQSSSCLSSIGDFVWENTNQNGIQDAGEPGVPGVTVNLLGLEDTVVAVTVTDDMGKYRFNEVPCGTYRVEFTKPVGYLGFSNPDQGESDDLDSDANQSTGRTGAVTTDSELPNDLSLDAGLIKTTAVLPPVVASVPNAQPTPSKLPNKLPSTGSDIPAGAGLLGGLLLVGGTVVLLARRKSRLG